MRTKHHKYFSLNILPHEKQGEFLFVFILRWNKAPSIYQYILLLQYDLEACMK
jgi:hypothetical protein